MFKWQLRQMNYFSLLKTSFLNIFQRQQGTITIIPEVDGLRSIAIIAVLISHFSMQMCKINGLNDDFIYTQPIPTFLELCGYGVNIFFFISAFILSIPFINYHLYGGEKVELKNYYLRRIKRLELPYILVLIVLLLFRILFQQQYWKDEMPHFFSSLFYSHNIIYGRRSTINPVAWTLEIEIQFYLLLPLLLKVLKITNTTKRRLFLTATILIWNFLYKYNFQFFEQHHLRFSVIAYMPVFLTGILLADFYAASTKKYGKKFLFDVASLLGFYLILYQSEEFVWYKQWLEFVGYILLCIGMFKGIITNYIFTHKAIMALGIMCYSIYLLHYSIIVFLAEKLTKPFWQNNYYEDFALQFFFIIPSVIIICSMFYLLIEKPLNKKLNPYLRTKN